MWPISQHGGCMCKCYSRRIHTPPPTPYRWLLQHASFNKLQRWPDGALLTFALARCVLHVPDEFQNFVRRLPTFYALNTSAIQYFWKMDPGVHQRYQQLDLGTGQLLGKARRIIGRLFTLSKRCRTQPRIAMPRER